MYFCRLKKYTWCTFGCAESNETRMIPASYNRDSEKSGPYVRHPWFIASASSKQRCQCDGNAGLERNGMHASRRSRRALTAHPTVNLCPPTHTYKPPRLHHPEEQPQKRQHADACAAPEGGGEPLTVLLGLLLVLLCGDVDTGEGTTGEYQQDAADDSNIQRDARKPANLFMEGLCLSSTKRRRRFEYPARRKETSEPIYGGPLSIFNKTPPTVQISSETQGNQRTYLWRALSISNKTPPTVRISTETKETNEPIQIMEGPCLSPRSPFE
ncbi:hypothetical protein C8J57DRAFT_1247581 [Mycena rebaudengoi]|nr:hypothetical protein C8J57DRAFT_1247581 [Mycena rebaudengoi]